MGVAFTYIGSLSKIIAHHKTVSRTLISAPLQTIKQGQLKAVLFAQVPLVVGGSGIKESGVQIHNYKMNLVMVGLEIHIFSGEWQDGLNVSPPAWGGMLVYTRNSKIALASPLPSHHHCLVFR